MTYHFKLFMNHLRLSTYVVVGSRIMVVVELWWVMNSVTRCWSRLGCRSSPGLWFGRTTLTQSGSSWSIKTGIHVTLHQKNPSLPCCSCSEYTQDNFYSAPPLLTTEQCSSGCSGGNQFALLSPGSIVQGKQWQDRSAVALQTFLPCFLEALMQENKIGKSEVTKT